MGRAGKYVGLESSHGFPPAAVDLDPDPEELPAPAEARLDKHRDAGHTLDDFKARGLTRPHRRVKTAKGAMSVDLAGPYRLGLGQVKFDVVAVYRLQDAEVLYFIRWLQRRNWQERFQVVRMHGGKGRELITEKLSSKIGLWESSRLQLLGIIHNQMAKLSGLLDS